MSSTILYKFRASSTFEALPLPGAAARLFDVKKAIVKANKLDTGTMEFDLAVRNADTNEEYGDESMLLPRGTRIIVQRLPAGRGQGFLARMARNEHGGGMGNSYQQQQHPSGYYTIDNQTRENEEDEFVESSSGAEKELAALQAVTSMQAEGPTMVGGQAAAMGAVRGGRGGPPRPAGMGGPPTKPGFHQSIAGSNASKPGGSSHFRPNADPELREQEKKLQPKKRATGIPRTFLNLSAPPQTDGNKEGADGEQQAPLLQPNKQGFKELVSRGGGQSESTAGTRRDLDYVLKLTSTTVPEHLQCAICNSIVKNAMLLPWDSEGRTVCESCIRDALTQNGFRCPLTGMDGVSPDDLIPNVGLRKAADMFLKGVMEKVDEIEQMQVEEAENNTEETTPQSSEKNVLDGEGAEKGVLVSKRTSLSKSKKSDEDPFGGDDDFGGDVFAVDTKHGEEGDPAKAKGETPGAAAVESSASSGARGDETGADAGPPKEAAVGGERQPSSKPDANQPSGEAGAGAAPQAGSAPPASTGGKLPKSPPAPAPQPASHMRFHRRRGPPVGYAMGPANGAVVSARANYPSNNSNNNNNNNPNQHHGQDYGGGGDRFSSRGGSSRNGGFHQDRNADRGSYGRDRGGRGRGGHRYSQDQEGSRGTKRSRDRDGDEGDGQQQQQIQQQQRRGRDHYRGDGRESHGREEGGGGGGYNRGRRGGRPRGGQQQQRGNYRGGQGSYGGDSRGRY